MSFEGEVGYNAAEIGYTIEPEAVYNNDSTSYSEPQASGKEILMPFREPKPPGRIPSLNSDIKNSNHQNNMSFDEHYGEADYMDESDGIDEMDDMTADPLENGVDEYLTTPEIANLTNNWRPDIMMNNKNPSINASDLVTDAMPSMPDLDKSQSARKANRGMNPHGINRLAVLGGGNNTCTSHSKSHSDSTTKAQGKMTPAGLPRIKNNHDTKHSNQAAATTTSSESVEVSEIYRQAQQLPYNPPNSQQQHYPEHQPTPHEIQSENTRELVKIFIGEIWNRGEIESIEKVCSPRLRFNGHAGLEKVGHEGFSRMVMTVRSSLEGYHCEIHSMVVEGRKCFCRLKFTGKHVGELMGYPPTNKLVAWMGASEFTICPRKKLILKVWELGDIKSLEAQLMG